MPEWVSYGEVIINASEDKKAVQPHLNLHLLWLRVPGGPSLVNIKPLLLLGREHWPEVGIAIPYVVALSVLNGVLLGAWNSANERHTQPFRTPAVSSRATVDEQRKKWRCPNIWVHHEGHIKEIAAVDDWSDFSDEQKGNSDNSKHSEDTELDLTNRAFLNLEKYRGLQLSVLNMTRYLRLAIDSL
ncbi:hypothetical protein K469DRAFT_696454 [Zopfia rhizophila CBS 207.26]|uniref:Uncharacterized protein n=1 Tax=Zopfia rhizophila CBS 207.26 TaxID=1314779 RepID=A0A6A6DEW6_9PEZI|nr:hypothetical protein K469DRAFT_696454 [Zopfia rhizophila CBS 207.26]